MSKARISVALLLTALMLMSGLAMGCPPRVEPDPVVVDPDPVVVQPCPVVVDPVIPIRYGAWVDDVIVTEVYCEATAITMLLAGDLDIYLSMMGCMELYAKVVESPYLTYWPVMGAFACFLTNQVGVDHIIEFEGRRMLNPMSVPRIREAMNWLVDRTHIAEHIFGGMATPRWTAFSPLDADFPRHIESIRAIELKFAYDLDRAREVIAEEMEKLGAELVNGTWHFEGNPVEMIVISPDWIPASVELGHYTATQLIKVGFYGMSYPVGRGEWGARIREGMFEGTWHLLTGGWIFPGFSWDAVCRFAWFYTAITQTHPIWKEMTPDPEFFELADRLRLRDFACMDERYEMVNRALALSMEDSGKIFTVQRISFVPHRYDIEVSGCLGGGVCAPNKLWAITLRHVDEDGNPVVGGTIRMAQPRMFIDPWNPVHGSNIPADQGFKRGMSKGAGLSDPFTGLGHPRLIGRTVTYAYEGKLFPHATAAPQGPRRMDSCTRRPPSLGGA